MNPLQSLDQLGERIWIDNIRRSMLEHGTLAQYIEEFALTGLTSNPTIFEHAIGGSDDYDEALRGRIGDGQSAEEIFYDLAIEDLQRAADLFRPVYERSEGRDGFVSLELSPALADDADGSVRQARELFRRMYRPNVLIKVPGTEAGCGAIETLIHEGIPVNVTLLFSAQQYEAAARAYLRGLEARLQDDLDPVVPSVASLFISRWDKASADHLPPSLRNRLGVAVAMQAYRTWHELLDSQDWRALAEAGARPQRLLWASTGTKDPELPEGYYVTALTAPETVATLPESTLLAFARKGRVGEPLPADGGDSARVLQSVTEAGVHVEALAGTLQQEGKDKFSKSYDSLLAEIEHKMATLAEASDAERESLGDLAGDVRQRLESLEAERVGPRIWGHDHTVWREDPEEVSNRLAWLGLPQSMPEEVERLQRFARRVREAGITHVLWSGMGGSSLFPEVLQQAFADQAGLQLSVLDTSNPVSVRRAGETLPLERTLFVFASKSGGTLETRCQLDYFWSLVDDPARHAVITDPGSPLAELARERGIRQLFLNEPDVGGRYSALSHFGLVAAALIGVDLGTLLKRAGQMAAACGPGIAPERHPGMRLGAALGAAALAGRDKCTLVMPEAIREFGMWLEQLIAESTGKHATGILPVADEPLGEPGAYGDDRVFVSLGDAPGLDALARAGHPVIRLPFVDRYSIGAEVFRWEFAIAVAGRLLGINPFDQPNVEAAKKAAGAVLEHGLPELPAGSVDDVLERLRPGSYLAIQAYLDLGSEDYARLQALRTRLRDRYRVATTLGYGPRYLHSTGQLHKGGPRSGVFVQVVSDSEPDLAVPGRPYSFGELFRAQAAGDYQALQEQDLPVFRVSLEDLLRAAD
ncbi:MAG TPA: bifunctional transaldolase/phosoglucose isomerase [Gammaproteobacteria bacterium]|nr:bifunctional transaldolase/phosoglucose isomerase [Gammaproteobacteria bacterium]